MNLVQGCREGFPGDDRSAFCHGLQHLRLHHYTSWLSQRRRLVHQNRYPTKVFVGGSVRYCCWRFGRPSRPHRHHSPTTRSGILEPLHAPIFGFSPLDKQCKEDYSILWWRGRKYIPAFEMLNITVEISHIGKRRDVRQASAGATIFLTIALGLPSPARVTLNLVSKGKARIG